MDAKPSIPCHEFRHNECRPWADYGHVFCDCPCHEDWD